MDLLSDLLESYHKIISDKLSERRTGAETLRKLLQADNSRDLIQDRSTSSSSRGRRPSSCGNVPSWDDLFIAVKECLLKEIENIRNLEQLRPNPSSSAQTGRKKQIQDNFETLRVLLKAANSKGGVLKVSEVMSHIMQVLKVPVLQRWLAMDYTQILVSHVLPYPHFTMELTHSNWKDLQHIFIDFYNSPPEALDQALIARCLHAILLQCSRMYDVIIPDWYRFFTASIKQAITKHNSEHLLSACNVFFLTVASNARGRLCKIGEDLVQPVIQVWDRSSPSLKDQILTFLHIQVRLHHPCGAVSEADGAWASNDAHWRNCIEKMNSFIIKELDLASKRSRSTSKCEATVSPSFINFTVDVMQQAYSHTDTSFTDTSLPPKVKRSRVDSGWTILKDSLSSSSSVLIWLQLIGHLFAKESVKFPTTEIIPLISELYNILIQLKKPDARAFTVLHWVFIALKSIASYTSNKGIVYNNWKDIWTGTIKALQYRIAEDTGYELLSTLLLLKFIKTVEVDAWKIICLTTPSKSVISFIRSLLAHHKIPESLTISLPHTINEDSPLPLLSLSSSSSSYQYRITLLNHICSILDIKKPLNGSKSSVLLPVYELSVVLVSLMQQSCSLSLTLSSTSNRCTQWVSDEFRQSLESFESSWYPHEVAYLQSSFDLNPLFTPPSAIPTAPRKEPVIDSLCSVLCDILSSHCHNLSQPLQAPTTHENKLGSLMEAKVYCCSLVLHVVTLLHYIGYPVETTSIYQLGPSLLKEVSSHLKDPIWSEADSSYYQTVVKTHLKHLSSLVSDSLATEFKDYIQSFIPLETVQDIILISKGKFASWVRSISIDSSSAFSATESTSNLSLGLNRHVSSANDDDDAFEDDFMDSEPSTHSDMSSLNPVSHHNLNILSPSLLSSKALVQQEACVLLVKWSYLVSECGSLCWSSVKNIMNDDSVNVSSAVTVQLILAITSNILQSPVPLPQEAIGMILQSLRKVLSKHRKNYFIHKEALVLLKRLIIGSNWSMEQSDCLSLLSAFWNLYSEGSLCPDIRCSLADALVAAVSTDLKGNVLFLTRKRKKKEEDPISVRDALIQFIVDADHSVRLHLARNITVLFPETNTPLEHMNNFNDLKDMLRKSTLVKSNLDEHSSEDESVNRVASMLCTLQSVACSARSCEYHVISLLVTSTGQGHMNSDIVKKVIRRISEYLGYANEICLLEEMLSYLVSQWMNEGTIDGFPYTLLSLDNINEFYRKYYRSVVPHILATDRDSLQSISDATLLSKEDLIKESLPVTMASILKAMAHSDGDEDSKRQAKDTNEYILSVISKETLNTSLKHSLPLLVVELLTRLYVPANSDSALAQYSNVCDPEPIPPHHSLSAISTTLQYLPSCFSSSTDSFISVLAKQKEALQTIALHLNLRIFSTHRVFERKRLLISYSYFSSLVSRELASGLHGSLPYMVMDIIYSVGRVMHHHGNDESISLICCDTLTNVTKAAIEKCPEVIGRHCHMIINTLLPLTQLPEPKNKPAIALLDYIIENGQIRALQDHLILLDPLPGEGPVKEASSRLDIIKASVNEQSLSREINRFCMVHSGNSIASDSVQGLKSLLHCLKSFHSELQINNPDTSNLILELIHTLLNTARHSPDSSCHVSQCLGEIGCIELQSISAHVVTNGGTRGRGPGGGYVFKQERDKIVASVLESLSVLLSDVSISVVKASSHCLRDVLSTNSGASVLQKLEHSVSQDDNQWFNVLEPFKQNKKKLTENLLTSVSRPLHNFSLLWKPSQDHSSWLRELVCSLITSGGVSDEVLSLVKPVCQVKLSFCESVFPLVVHDILSSNSGEKSIMESLSKQVGDFLTESVSMDPIPHQSINSVINIVMSLRKMPRLRKGGTAWENNFWLDLNFLDIANAAFKCCSYFTSLLYIEIWCNHQGFDASNLTAYPEVQGLLLQVYSQIGEHDGSYGAHLLFSPKEEFTRKLDEHEGRWEELLTYSNWEGMLTGKCNELLDKGCKSLAYYHMLDVYKKETSDSTSQQCYTENIWRLTQWRDTDDMNLLHVGTTDNYHPCLHNLLLTLKHNKKAQFDEFITKGRASIINEMVSTSLESVCNINPHLTRLQTLNELESTFQLVLEPDLSPSVLLSNWKGKLSNMSTDFELVELVLSVRFHALLSVLPYYKRSGGENESLIQSGLLNVLSTKASLAIEAQQYQVAKVCVLAMKHIVKEHCSVSSSPSSSSLYIDPLLEEAKLYWSQGKADIAMLLMKDILEKLECHQEGVAYPTVLTLYGNWLSETLSERPLVILEEYLEKAVSLLESQPVNKDQLLHAYLSLARYSDNQFRRISDHMNSPLYQAKQKLLDRAKTDLQSMSKAKPDGRSTEFPKHYRQLSKLSEEDELIIRQHEQDQRQFLNKSIINYSLCLSTGEQYNLRIFRLMSLWFTSSTDPLINELIKDYVSSLPSYKLLPVIYQLAARMSSLNSDPFQHILQEMLYRLGKDHPYHSLYVILALSNAGIDNEFPQKGYVTGQRRSNGGAMSNGTKLRRSGGGAGGRGGGVGQCVVDDEKVKAAQDLLNRLRSVNGELLRDISSLCEAYVDMAYHDVTAHKTEKKPIRIPPNCPLLKLKKNKVPIPTLDHPIDPSGRYKDSMVTITSFDAHFSLCGGVNLPKVLSALCSDGKRRRQLIKGRDDLRQDAVMQQVFGLVNQLLCKKPSTANRKLLIRTYKVVPLSQCSGIVQWCEGTVPIGMYLVGPPESPLEGAHVRYRPKDWKNNECRAKFAQSSKGDKLTVYNQICKHFKPVFHHFFMESFPDPALWYERRLTYTRSIATSSIVGYIMGLGDRHVQNILIDKQSAELIHIDLGVAFEQGRALPTPEVIPFRLTRDLVSGMGITGVVGVFQRCCEETMEVMRSSHEELRTIVEVLLHDPLYIWTISNKKARHIQSSTAVEWAGGDTSGANDVSSNNKMAERVLIRLQEKLEGVENGVQLSVGGQVTHLIQEARDSVNLSSLFHGWQPWI